MNNNFENLNEQQLEAVTSDYNKPILVVAGAGAGKTKVLISRIEYLLNNTDVRPNKILAITFTNKAANEIKERIRSLNIQNVTWIGTFHSMCLRILREDFEYLGREKNFTIIDDQEQISIIKEIFRFYKIDTKELTPKTVLRIVNDIKQKRMNPEYIKSKDGIEFYALDSNKNGLNSLRIFEEYEKRIINNNYLDFNDLLNYTAKLFELDEMKEKWSHFFDYILIDEYQDTNTVQYEIVKTFVKKNKRIFVVGDPDQMIYGWRGADERVILSFEKDFPNSKKIILTQNYRSTQGILNAANNLVKINKNRFKKELVANNNDLSKPIYYIASNADDESKWVTNKILKLLKEGVKNKDIAILYRANFLSRNIEQSLMLNNMKYIIFGGVKFYQRKEVKDIIAYLRVIYADDELSYIRIINTPKRKISPVSVNKISDYAYVNNLTFSQALKKIENIEIPSMAINSIKSFVKIMDELKNEKEDITKIVNLILEKTNYIDMLKDNNEFDRIENINELKFALSNFIKTNNATIEEFLEELSLYSNTDENKEINHISLMTVHNSKGLEFKNVFLIGMVENIFPSHRANFGPLLEEERRVAYVALTRAKEKLFISSRISTFSDPYQSINSHFYGGNEIPSRFIKEIGLNNLITEQREFVKFSNFDSNWFNSKDKKEIGAELETGQENNYVIGDEISHTVFGSGIIIGINGSLLDISFKPPYYKKSIKFNHKAIIRKLN